MNTPAQEHVCYDFLCSFEQGIREHPQKEADTSDQKSLEINIADKIEALLEDYPACDALIRFRSYLDAEVERYRSANDERRKIIVENVAKALDRQIEGDTSLGEAMKAARKHDNKCRKLAQKDWLNHVDFMALIGILDGVKSLKLDEARIEEKQYLVESFKGCLPSEKLILLNESPAFPCTPMELADWFKQIRLTDKQIIPSFFDELAAIEATKATASPGPEQATGLETSKQQGFGDLESIQVRRERTLIEWLEIQEKDKAKSFDRQAIKKKKVEVWEALSNMSKDFPPVSQQTIKTFFKIQQHCRFDRGRRPG